MAPPYDPVGRCIYCPATVYSPEEPLAKFGNEHIIARLLKGTWQLPEASCKKCETVTSGIETVCADTFFRAARAHLGFKARKSRKARKHVSTNIISPPLGTQKIQIQDHPGALFGFKFDPPNILRGLPLSYRPPQNRLLITPLVSNIRERLDRFGHNTQMQVAGNLSHDLYARLLAKIAHALAVAECGLGGFEPFLLDLIHDRSSLPFSAYVGSATVFEPPTSSLHLLRIHPERIGNETYIVAIIRLFAHFPETPTHYVVAGRSQAP